MKIVLMRGTPGSGKSYKARQILEAANNDGVILSTDNMFMSSNGIYLWNAPGLSNAHVMTKNLCAEACQRKIPLIIVDNTNSTAWEQKPYLELANHFNYEVEIVEPDTSWKYDADECFRRCTHSVPLESIRRVIERIRSH